MTRQEDELDRVIQYRMAKSSMDAMREYLVAGRPYQSLTLDGLGTMFIARFRTWIAEFSYATQRLVNELDAEYQLRNEKPPYEALESEMAELHRRTKVVMANVTAERMEEVGRGLIEEYRAALAAQQ